MSLTEYCPQQVPSAGMSDWSYIIQTCEDSSLILLQSHSLAILSNSVKKTTNKSFSSIAAEIQELKEERTCESMPTKGQQ